MKAKIWNLNTLLYLALLLALLSSLGHVAYAFSTVNGGNWTEAYISAVSIDVGLLALAAGINQRKAQNRDARVLWAGVIFFSAISTYANWLAGLAHVKPFDTELGKFAGWLVTLRPILLSAVLPVLVIYLSEIVSSNYQIDQKQQQRDAKKRDKLDSPADKSPSVQPELSTLDKANEVKQDKIEQRRDKVLQMFQAGQEPEAIATALDVSVRTIKRDIKSLNGQVRTQ